MAKIKDFISKLMPGVGQPVKAAFKGGSPAVLRDEVGKPDVSKVYTGFPTAGTAQERAKYFAHRFYREGSFEKVQFARKWMRNILMLQGYHELEWAEVNVAWDALIRDPQDYAYPNNYYRSHIRNGASLYLQNEPKFDFAPGGDDYNSQAIAKAAKSAFEIIKENVNYDYMRALEAFFLRLCGNSFRYSYYSLDPQYGHVSAAVYTPKDIQIGNGSYNCPNCGMQGEGNPNVCPQCGQAMPPTALTPPTMTRIPEKTGVTTYPRGMEQCEIVSPMEVGVRSSSYKLSFAPYIYRARIVDRIALQSDNPDVDIMTAGSAGYGDEGGGDAYAAAQDLALVYQQSLADLPGDPTQYAAWYERATSYARCLYLQMWVRPAQYAFDDELKEMFPDGMALDIADMGTLLEARNESMDDHWVHFGYQFVPGRFWWDGDDDMIPAQLKLNETDRLIQRNVAYNSVPQKLVDKQRVDVDQLENDPERSLIVIKTTGRNVNEAVANLEGQQLPQEVWQYRASQLEDMQYHSGVFPSSVGAHQPGNNSYGGQEFAAAKTEQAMSPMLLIYKEANETWAKQMLKLAANNWLDDRVKQTQGINGQWEFQKLRGRMLQLDKVKITAAILPIDYTEQQSFAQAVASGVLNPQDPRVQRKALELYNLPTELNTFSADAKVQWDEIDKMKQGMQVQPVFMRDNDQVHAEICREWLNSDEGRTAPMEIQQAVMLHMQLHLTNVAKANAAQAAQESAGDEVRAHVAGGGVNAQGQVQAQQPQRPGQQRPGQQPTQVQQRPPQGGRHGGQIPTQSSVRQQRAVKGQAAKPKRPQPSSGNQYGVRK